MLRTRARTAGRLEPLAAKVPEITALFWILKVLTTGMGEAISDYLGEREHRARRCRRRARPRARAALQLRDARLPRDGLLVRGADGRGVRDDGRRRHPRRAARALRGRRPRSTRSSPPACSSSGTGGEGTLSIHSIVTRRRESFYWLAVLGTFALGTAAGDFTASQLQLGYLGSIALFAVVDRRSGDRLVAVRAEPDRRVLGGVRADPPARRLVRRLDRQAGQAAHVEGRPRIRRRRSQRGRARRVRAARRLRGDHDGRTSRARRTTRRTRTILDRTASRASRVRPPDGWPRRGGRRAAC